MQYIEKKYFESELKDYLDDIFDKEQSDEKEALSKELIAKMGDVRWDVDAALHFVVPTIKNRMLRNDCRSLLIAEKYDAAESYYGRVHSDQPWIGYVGDKCVLLQYPHERIGCTAAILTPEGDVKTPEGLLWINGNSLSYKWCFNARGVDNGKHGLVYGDGKIILPCVFDYIENDVVIEAQYKGVAFSVTISDKPFDPEHKLLSYANEYRVADDLFINFSCLGLKTEHSYSESMAAPLYDGKPLNKKEKREYENTVKAELFAILDEHYRGGLE
jgi:hypothetical protein